MSLAAENPCDRRRTRLLRLWLSSLAALATMAAVGAPAQANPVRGESITRRIDRLYSGRSTLGVRQLLGLGREYEGSRVRSVILRASSAHGRADARLLVNNLQVDRTQTIGRMLNDNQFYLPIGQNILGRDIRSLQLDLVGNVRVESITVLFQGRQGRPVGRVLRAPLNRSYVGNNGIRLVDLFPELRRPGVSVRTVTMVNGARGRGQATLCGIRACTGARLVDARSRMTVFDASGIAGNAPGALRLELRGNHWIDEIRIEISNRPGVRPGPRPVPRPPGNRPRPAPRPGPRR